MIRRCLPFSLIGLAWFAASLDFAKEGAYTFHNPVPWRTAQSWAQDLTTLGTCPKPDNELPIVPPPYLANRLKRATTRADWQRWFGASYCTRVLSGGQQAEIWKIPFWEGHFLMLTFRQEAVSHYDILRSQN